jgi:hypothetical protein
MSESDAILHSSLSMEIDALIKSYELCSSPVLCLVWNVLFFLRQRIAINYRVRHERVLN